MNPIVFIKMIVSSLRITPLRRFPKVLIVKGFQVVPPSVVL